MGTAGFGGSFAPSAQYEKWEIHPVFPHFSYFRLCQNLSPNLLAPLCGAALSFQSHSPLGLWESLLEVVFVKKKTLLIGSYLLVALLAAAVTLSAVLFVQRSETSKLDSLEALIQERFIGEVDTTALEDAAAEAMVKATGDRWSYYIPASSYESHKEQSENAFVGVGITIQQVEGGFLVVEVTPEGPGQEAGILPGDLLIAVDSQDVRELTMSDVRNLVRGEEGSFVSLTVLRNKQEVTVSAQRRRIEVQVASGQMLEDNVGLVTIENFDSRCADETIAAIEALLSQGAERLIFDVRNNPGGYASEMVEVLDYLLPEGDLFRTVRYDGKEDVDRSDAKCLDLPMAVLVNGDSYSAAEFFAAALSEYEAAIVVGEKTCGKGYFQNTYRLNDGSAVALSVGKYFTPKGVSLAGVGITPDVPVEVDEETAAAILYNTLPWQEDPQIQAALSALND